MPLIHDDSDEAFHANLKAELDAGKPKDQALAIAYSIKRRAAARRRLAKAGYNPNESRNKHGEWTSGGVPLHPAIKHGKRIFYARRGIHLNILQHMRDQGINVDKSPPEIGYIMPNGKFINSGEAFDRYNIFDSMELKNRLDKTRFVRPNDVYERLQRRLHVNRGGNRIQIYEVGKDGVKKFDENEPRDNRGRWASSGVPQSVSTMLERIHAQAKVRETNPHRVWDDAMKSAIKARQHLKSHIASETNPKKKARLAVRMAAVNRHIMSLAQAEKHIPGVVGKAKSKKSFKMSDLELHGTVEEVHSWKAGMSPKTHPGEFANVASRLKNIHETNVYHINHNGRWHTVASLHSSYKVGRTILRHGGGVVQAVNAQKKAPKNTPEPSPTKSKSSGKKLPHGAWITQEDFDAKHPHYPAGTPGGKGGEFAPKDASAASVAEHAVKTLTHIDPDELKQHTNQPYDFYGQLHKKLVNLKMNEYPYNSTLLAFSDYQGSGYQEINGFLRGKGHYSYTGDIKKKISAMDKYLGSSKATLKHTLFVWRGITDSTANKLKEGTVFEDKGYFSTSLDHNTASGFTKSTHYMMRVEVPKGAKAAIYNTSEREVLLPRNSRFQVTHIEKKAYTTSYGTTTKYTVYHAKLVKESKSGKKGK